MSKNGMTVESMDLTKVNPLDRVQLRNGEWRKVLSIGPTDEVGFEEYDFKVVLEDFGIVNYMTTGRYFKSGRQDELYIVDLLTPTIELPA